jgi:hypothetical protein
MEDCHHHEGVEQHCVVNGSVGGLSINRVVSISSGNVVRRVDKIIGDTEHPGTSIEKD